MKQCRKELNFHAKTRRAYVNITPQVEAASMKYVRIQGRETAYRTGMPVGIFAAVHRLQQGGGKYHLERLVWREWVYPYRNKTS
jgi:hypothetical protein